MCTQQCFSARSIYTPIIITTSSQCYCYHVLTHLYNNHPQPNPNPNRPCPVNYVLSIVPHFSFLFRLGNTLRMYPDSVFPHHLPSLQASVRASLLLFTPFSYLQFVIADHSTRKLFTTYIRGWLYTNAPLHPSMNLSMGWCRMHFRCCGETWFVANRFMRAPRGSKTESAIGIAPHRLSPAYVENQGSASTYKKGHLGIFACCWHCQAVFYLAFTAPPTVYPLPCRQRESAQSS